MNPVEFDTVLVANRGEIARRVIRSARALGYRTVAVYSDADAGAPHCRDADLALRIGPAPAAQSYLDIEAILDAARRAGAQAIHPGYGFLSENAAFAAAVRDAGLVFIGPDAEAIEAMGSKSAAKRLMLAAGVPCVPGFQGAAGELPDDARLVAEAKFIGLPVMIKAAAGGGGRGMRLVHDEAALADAIASARSEASSAFGSGELLIEKAVVGARHVEVQVFGDRHGQVVHLGERDCSVQRRNQKLVEESPSPAVNAALRARMGEAAVAAARAVNYVGAGTVEFLLGRDGEFYFLEMNTRLQVEHPVTELRYGLDLVEWQLRVARGEPLPMSQAELDARPRGHAIEVRLCAEDPAAGWAPQAGPVLLWQPPVGEGIRVDAGLETGGVVSPYYDSMQAKLIAWGEDREVARRRLLQALQQTLLAGVRSNRDALAAILRHPVFAAGAADTGFIDAQLSALLPDAASPLLSLLAAVTLYRDDAARLATDAGLPAELVGWHSGGQAGAVLRLSLAGQVTDLALSHQAGRYTAGETWLEVTAMSPAGDGRPGRLDYRHADGAGTAHYVREADALWLAAESQLLDVRDESYAPAVTAAPGSDGRILAHSDGRIVQLRVAEGERVEAGQPLLVLEAMKMEFQLDAPVAGTVAQVAVEAGTQVAARQLLIRIQP